MLNIKKNCCSSQIYLLEKNLYYSERWNRCHFHEYFLVENFFMSFFSHGISITGSLNVKIQVVREDVQNIDYV